MVHSGSSVEAESKNDCAHDLQTRSYAAALQQTIDSVKEDSSQNIHKTRFKQVVPGFGHAINILSVSSSTFSCFDEIPEAATRAAVSSGIRDPFHYDWPFWC